LPPTHAGSSLADFYTLKKEATRSPKRWFDSQELHGATSQKTAFFIVPAVKTSNPTNKKRLVSHVILHVTSLQIGGWMQF
jgi:hypothetical protein